MGEPNVDALLANMSSQQYDEWAIFCELEPFGDEWRQAAMAPFVLASVFARKGRKPKLEEFMPHVRKRDISHNRMSVEAMASLIQSIAAVHKDMGNGGHR